MNYANQSATVVYDSSQVQAAGLRSAVQGIGYDLVVQAEDPQAVQEAAQAARYQQMKQRTAWAALLTVPVVILGMAGMHWAYTPVVSLVLSAPVVFYWGAPFFVNAWKQARHRKANMDTLVALSTGVAFIFSVFNTFFPSFWWQRGLPPHVYYEAASVVIVFVSLGKLLEEKARSRTSAALRKLIELQPKTVALWANGETREVPVSTVQRGDEIWVRPGEKIALDGVVTFGNSYVDESSITGEPVPAAKHPGEKVYAGTINQKGSFRFEARAVGHDTVLAQIIAMVREAQGSKAPVQRLVDRIAGIFVPVVISLALLTFMVWMIWGGAHAFTHALLASVTVLVIACPCALGLATPTAIMVGVGKGAEHHILIKDAESLERAHEVDTVVLDKTGTITAGHPEVTAMLWHNGTDTPTHRAILYALEQQSEHPLAEAVVRALSAPIQPVTLRDFESMTGLGVKGYCNGIYYVGSEQLCRQLKLYIPTPLQETASIWRTAAHTVIYFANEKEVLAILAITDVIKSSAVAAIADLKSRGITVYMLTGDNETTAAAVAQQTGITHYRAQMLPGDKASYIQQLQQTGKVVAMVGDGINDSQALAQADVSFAMGKGADIARDVARITLLTSDLQAVPRALRLSSLTVRGIRQNLFWAFIYNVMGIPIAAGVLYPINGFLLDPMIAGAAMALSSLSVVGNSLRLRAAKL